MQFLVSEIRSAGRLDRDESLDPAPILGNPPEFVSFRYPLKVMASAVMTGSDVVISANVSTTLRFICGRCLEPYERSFKADFQQVFSSELKEIDISNDIQEVVYIDLPITPVCREDCKGLCSTCGKNRNEFECKCQLPPGGNNSARWDGLNKIRFH